MICLLRSQAALTPPRWLDPIKRRELHRRGFVAFSFADDADNGPQLLTTVEAPDCFEIAPYCMVNWGVGSATVWGLNDVNGGLTACNAFRAAKNGVPSFMDGHVKKMSMGALAAGTSFSPTQSYANTVFTDRSKYIWDTQ